MKILCPHCHQHYGITPEYLGLMIQCHTCGESFLIEPLQKIPLTRTPCRGGYRAAYITGGVLGGVSFLFAAFWACFPAGAGSLNWIVYLLCTLGVLIASGFLIRPELEIRTRAYILTEDKICKKWGVFDKMRQEICLSDIKSIQSSQDRNGKRYGYHNIIIETLFDDTLRMDLYAVKDAEKFIMALQERKDACR